MGFITINSYRWILLTGDWPTEIQMMELGLVTKLDTREKTTTRKKWLSIMFPMKKYWNVDWIVVKPDLDWFTWKAGRTRKHPTPGFQSSVPTPWVSAAQNTIKSLVKNHDAMAAIGSSFPSSDVSFPRHQHLPTRTYDCNNYTAPCCHVQVVATTSTTVLSGRKRIQWTMYTSSLATTTPLCWGFCALVDPCSHPNIPWP